MSEIQCSSQVAFHGGPNFYLYNPLDLIYFKRYAELLLRQILSTLFAPPCLGARLLNRNSKLCSLINSISSAPVLSERALSFRRSPVLVFVLVPIF